MASTISAGTTAGSAIVVSGDTSGSLALQTNGTTTAVTIDTSQNVGIGTTTPNSKLDVTAASGVQISATNGTIAQRVGYCGYGSVFSGSATNHPYVLLVNDTERMRLDTSGNVGIGATTLLNPGTPDAKTLTVSATKYPQIFSIATTAAANNTTYRTIARDTGVYQIQLINDAGTSEQTAYEISRSANSVGYQRWFGGTTEAMRIDSSGNLLFNSGYGSAATAYGCRAWVNFNGTGTVAIRASGNVSSITDNGTGDYTVNFTTAMPDANYIAASTGGQRTINWALFLLSTTVPTTSAFRYNTTNPSDVALDNPYNYVSFFR